MTGARWSQSRIRIRNFRTEGDTPDQINQYRHANFGDVRLWGMYTGLLEDMSLGLLAGFKLATGDHTYSHFDRDTSIGTGSTDLLIGGYKLGSFPTHIGNLKLTFREKPFEWFVQGQYDYPFLSTGNYVPGKEFDAALGSFYNFGKVGPLKELAPIAHALRCRFVHMIKARNPMHPAAVTNACCWRPVVR